MPEPRSRRQYKIMCKDQFGNDLEMTFTLTRGNRAVAVKRSTETGLVMLAPRVLRQLVNALRDLEAQTYEGDTW